jgi:hypothetical protein
LFGLSIPSKIQIQQSAIGNPMSVAPFMAHCPSQPNALTQCEMRRTSRAALPGCLTGTAIARRPWIIS